MIKRTPSRFIAERLIAIENKDGSQMSRPAVRIASLSMIIGLVVMLLSVAIVLGFKREVRSQVIGFGGHIQVSPYTNLFSDDDSNPLIVDSTIISTLNSIEGVKCSQPTAMTAAMIKTDSDFKGIVLKGVDSLYDWSFFQRNMVEGSVFSSMKDSLRVNNGAIISKTLSERLGIKVGDRITTYFFKERLRARKLTITGIYSTSFIEYDNTYVLTDAMTVQRINGWEGDEYSMIEILIDDYENLDAMSDEVFMELAYMFENQSKVYRIENIKEVVPDMFEWLDMLDINTIVILTLMILVSGFCMISGLLILILERRETIGVLKALGANDFFIRKIFLWQSLTLISRSMLWGNLIGLFLIGIEWIWHIIPLDPTSYYVNYVPVYLNLGIFVGLNVAVFLVAVIMMIAPTYLATRISPVEAMRSE